MSTDHERETLKKVVDLLSQLKTLLKHNYIQFFHISLPSSYNYLFLAINYSCMYMKSA